MTRGEVYREKDSPPKLGSGGNIWVYESSSTYTRHGSPNTRHYFVGPSLTDDGSHYHLMSYSVDDEEFQERFEKHHDGFLNMPKEYQDKVRLAHGIHRQDYRRS